MGLKMNDFRSVARWTTLLTGTVLAAGLGAQTPQTPTPPAAQVSLSKPAPQTQPTFKVAIDLVTNDVVVRDEKGNFVSDLKRDEFEIYEDGVKQDISSMTVVSGGRVTNLLAPPPPPPPEGIILPPPRQADTTSGRIFVFFVDDLHMQFRNTGRIRDLFKRIEKNLVHDGDMFAIVSSGPSSIAVDLTYDKNRLEEAIKKIAGNGLKPDDIINGASGSDGPSEVRYRAHVAFSTVSDFITELEKVHNRRKAVVWVSDGYDFNPFQDARLGNMDPNSPFAQNDAARNENQVAQQQAASSGTAAGQDPLVQQQMQSEEFADADLARELSDLTRSANRANATFYTIDPRGLVGDSDIDENLDPVQWQDYVRKSQDSLRVLADQTGGLAVVNQNDFDKALKKIDAETSDYYVLGYYSSNPDPLRKRRKIEVRVTRKGPSGQALNVYARKEYVFKPPPPPVSTTKKELLRFPERRLPRLRWTGGGDRLARPPRGFLQIRFVHVHADEVDAESRARDGGAAEADERIHRHADTPHAVEPQALLRELRRKRRRVWPVAIAPLDRLVGDEPRVPAAAHAVRPRLPPPDVRLILIGHAERQPIEPGRSLRREVKDEFLTVVQEPVTVDRLVVADREVPRQPGRGARRVFLDGDRLHPVDGVLQPQMRPRRLRHVERRPRIARLRADVEEQRAVRRQHARRRGDPPVGPLEVVALRHLVAIAVVFDAEVVRRRRDNHVHALRRQMTKNVKTVGQIELSATLPPRDDIEWFEQN